MITLTSAQRAAYYYVNLIRKKIKEPLIDRVGLRFKQIFDDLSLEDWRDLYLDLATQIQEYLDTNKRIVQETIPKSYVSSIEAHDILNDMLLKAITKKKTKTKKIPDIDLSLWGTKPSIIETNQDTTTVNMLSCFEMKLPENNPDDYILTGDTNELDLYYTFLATLFILNRDFANLVSKEELLRHFPKEYAKYASEGAQEHIEEQFERVSTKTEEDRLIKLYGDVKPFFKESIRGLNKHINKASQIANNIVLSIQALKKAKTT